MNREEEEEKEVRVRGGNVTHLPPTPNHCNLINSSNSNKIF